MHIFIEQNLSDPDKDTYMDQESKTKTFIENRSIKIKISIVTDLLNHNTYPLELTKLASGPLPGTYHKNEFTSRNAALKLKSDNRYTLPLVHATDIAC